MTGADLAEWEAFEHIHGPILLHDRLDALQAMLCYVAHASAGGKEPYESFVPRWDRARADEEKEERMVGALRGLASVGRRDGD